MKDTRIRLKVRNYILSEVEKEKTFSNISPTDYRKMLEDTKDLAFQYWDIICQLQKNSSSIRIEHYYSGEIYVFRNNNAYIGELENFCECDAFIPIISIVAENSKINGKFNVWHRYPVKYIDFSF